MLITKKIAFQRMFFSYLSKRKDVDIACMPCDFRCVFSAVLPDEKSYAHVFKSTANREMWKPKASIPLSPLQALRFQFQAAGCASYFSQPYQATKEWWYGRA